MSIRSRILSIALGGIVFTSLLLVAVVLYQHAQLETIVTAELDRTARSECAKVANDVLLMVRTQQENSRLKLEADIRVAVDQLTSAGAVSFDTQKPVPWKATNQFTQTVTEVTLPALHVGGQWLQPNSDPGKPTPVVDKITQLTGSTATIFQRMNDQGDMLRVATTVINRTGQRAVGTFIPVIGADGQPNAVLATVLKGQPFVGRAKVVDHYYLTAYHPIFDEQKKVVGMIYTGVREENVDALRRGIMDIVVGKTGYVFVVGGKGENQGRYILSAGGKRDGEVIWEAKDADGNLFIQELVKKGMNTTQGKADFVTYPWQNPGDKTARQKITAVTYFEPWDWVIGAGAYQDDFEDAMIHVNHALNQLLWWTIIGATLVLLIVGPVAWVMANRVTRPIRNIVSRIKDIAQGEGDLTKRVEITTKDEVGELGTWFNTFVQKVHDIVAQVAGNTREVAGAATQIASSSEQMAGGMQNQAQQVTQISAAIEQMSQSVVEVARKSAEAAQSASGAGDKAQRGGQVVSQTITGIEAVAGIVNDGAQSVSALGKRSEQIGRIVEVINDIADQTNLLALNAAIEAARAGEHGRGFAVVADEVRKLADRTTKATEEIAQSIRAIQGETGQAVEKMNQGTSRVHEGVERAREAGASLGEIVTAAQSVAEMIRSIAAAAEEQSAAGEQISRNVASIQSTISESTQGANQAAQAASQLSSQAEQLQRLVSQFKLAGKAA